MWLNYPLQRAWEHEPRRTDLCRHNQDQARAAGARLLKEGETVKVKVIAIKDGKLSLSMKALLEKPAEETHNDRDYRMPKSENISTNLGSLLANIKL